jgi:hypothetical protein
MLEANFSQANLSPYDPNMLFISSDRKLNSWLQIAVKLGIEELALRWCCIMFRKMYKFPCSLLSDCVRNSIRYLEVPFVPSAPQLNLAPYEA